MANIIRYGETINNWSNKYAAFNVNCVAENASEKTILDQVENNTLKLWRNDMTTYRGTQLTNEADILSLFIKVTNSGGTTWNIPMDRVEVLQPSVTEGNVTNYWFRVYFCPQWQDFLTNYLSGTIASVVVNALVGTSIAFSQELTQVTAGVIMTSPASLSWQIEGENTPYVDIAESYQFFENSLQRKTCYPAQIFTPCLYDANDNNIISSYEFRNVSSSTISGLVTLSFTIRLYLSSTDTAQSYDYVRSVALLQRETQNNGAWLFDIDSRGTNVVTLLEVVNYPVWQLGSTTTEYKKGDITAIVKLDISTRAASIQSQVESNGSMLTYRLYNDSYDFAGVGTYQSKVEVTDAEQGTMYRNTINVAFTAVPVGSYTLECSIDYNGTIYTESIAVNVVQLTLDDFGINLYLISGYVLNTPIYLTIGVTTGGSAYTKPNHAKIVISCNETGKSMTRCLTFPYGGNNYVDLRAILPTYYDVANATFTLTLTGYMYNSNYVQYNEGESTLNVNVLGVCLPIRGQEHTTPKSCINNYERLRLIIPQMLEPKCGIITKMWLLHYDDNVTLYINGVAAQTLAVDNKKKFNTTLVTFDDLTAIFSTKIGNSMEYTIRPQIVSNCEQIAVKFDTPLASIEMPIFEMEVISNHFELGDVKTTPIYPRDVLRLNVQSYCSPSNNQIITLRLRGLNAGSVWYYNNILRTQPTLLLSYTATDAESFERYYVTNIQVTEPTDGVDNGQITLSLKSNNLQW